VCHNARKRDNPDISGGLALDTFEGVLAGTPQHKVLVPGRSSQSELVSRVNDADEERRMPLQDRPLPASQRDLIRRWIDDGAPRGVPVTAASSPARSATATTTATTTATGGRAGRAARRGPALDVVLPTNVRLVPKGLNRSQGGTLEVVLPIGPLPPVTALAFRGDDRLLAVGTYGHVVLWDLHDSHPAGTIRGIPGPVHALAFSRDGRRLALGAGLPAR
jgi:hypothetical protein